MLILPTTWADLINLMVRNEAWPTRQPVIWFHLHDLSRKSKEWPEIESRSVFALAGGGEVSDW